jgi:DNA modification methylase
MEIKQRKIKDLKAADYNPRNISDTQITHLKKSLDKFQCVEPIIVNTYEGREDIIVGGHQRLKAMKQLGYKEVPTIEVCLPLKEEKELNVRLNKNTGEFDFSLLEQEFELDDLLEWGFEDDELNFDVEEIEEVEGEDDVPEVPEIPKTVKGDIWTLGNHRLMCGDSTVQTDVDKLMGGSKADMVFTDPPYGISEKGDRQNRFSKDSVMQKGCKYQDFKDDSIQYAVDAFNIAQGLDIKRQVWWGANYYAHHIPQTNNWFVWDKRVEEKQRNTESDCELAWVKSKWSSVRIFRHLWKGLCKGSEHGQARVHPTQKPVALAEWAFDYFKDVKSVLDLFGGSGSTLIACEKTRRKCYMMEFEPHYCDVIIKRWQDFTGQEAINQDGKKYNEL